MKQTNAAWFVIINPNAGKGKGRRDWPVISSLLAAQGISSTFQFTGSTKDATRIAKKAVHDGFRNFIVIGGDGTLNEVINGCFNQQDCKTEDVTIAMVPVGTGNDWGRQYKIGQNYETAVRNIALNKKTRQDVGWIRYKKKKKKRKRYFVNTAGFGYDAEVVKKTNRQKLRGRTGAFLYFYNLLICLLKTRFYNTQVWIDNEKVVENVFSICVAIGRYSGGGMVQAPNAIPDDGLFDITIIKSLRKMEVMRSIKLLYNDQILSHNKVMAFKGREVSIQSQPRMKFQVDGETIAKGKVTIGIIPKSVNVIIG